jgi:hypothetical protein
MGTQSNRAERIRKLAAGEVEVEHGLYETYINWACRCVPCKAANAAYQRDLQKRKRAKEAEER